MPAQKRLCLKKDTKCKGFRNLFDYLGQSVQVGEQLEAALDRRDSAERFIRAVVVVAVQPIAVAGGCVTTREARVRQRSNHLLRRILDWVAPATRLIDLRGDLGVPIHPTATVDGVSCAQEAHRVADFGSSCNA